ncbi:hypothetical protein HB364_00555 [Pseudoflavitalea sp. X16]|uniref:H-type lectin domain-containing protein n=1 Tax=Paraflavitalea devenefica TaxID=2716334 RepID=UPI001423207A|nr:H-type lectin domain-containing protein [Paraflavitalea devenefica]NII23550.1 hypothetical protein [Paraflavitalea devenefica]
MKSHLYSIGLLFMAWYSGHGQSVAIGTGGTPANASAALDLQSNNKGFLIPRVTQTARLQLQRPATGLLVYQTDSPAGFYFNTGTPEDPDWAQMGSEEVFVRDMDVIRPNAAQANDLIFGRRHLPGPSAVQDGLFWFQKDKGAFRTGVLESSGWTSIAGAGSFATGKNSRATGEYSFASGDGAEASGLASFSTGVVPESAGSFSLSAGMGSKASGWSSMAIGLGTQAAGLLTQSLGEGTLAHAVSNFTVGMYNDPISPIQTFMGSDLAFFMRPQFIVGNGRSNSQRWNAFSSSLWITVMEHLQIGRNNPPFTNLQTDSRDFPSCPSCTVEVLFKTAYPGIPKVFASVSAINGNSVYTCAVRNITTTGFTLAIHRESGPGTVDITVKWFAMQ